MPEDVVDGSSDLPEDVAVMVVVTYPEDAVVMVVVTYLRML
jgi:hypothetical protein